MADDVTFPLPELTSSVGPAQASDQGYTLHPDQENLFLALYRLVPCEVTNGGDGDGNKKQQYLDAVVDRWDEQCDEWGDDPSASPRAAYVRRLEDQLKGLADAGTATRRLNLETEGRLIAGLGYDSPLEVGFTLHPLYGFPYLPGSSVKGVARAYAEEVAGAADEELLTVFGSPSKDEHNAFMQQGAVTFMDAMPTEAPALKVDVMTPHYGEYYQDDQDYYQDDQDYYQDDQDKVWPGDWLEPTPVPFLTVAGGTPFCFPLTSRDEAALEQAATWLKQGLFWLGAGGKTAAGYGLFTDKERRRTVEKRREQRREQ